MRTCRHLLFRGLQATWPLNPATNTPRRHVAPNRRTAATGTAFPQATFPLARLLRPAMAALVVDDVSQLRVGHGVVDLRAAF